MPRRPGRFQSNRALPGVVNIESDEERGAYAMVQYLIAWGHRRVMHRTGPAGLTGARRRIAGYRRALAEAGIPFDPHLQVAAGYTRQLGRAAMRSWLQRPTGRPLPQAIFCANAAVAAGCLEALEAAGLRVPEDISVAGFDDTAVARSMVPQLTSVRQPLAEMGGRAVDLLLDQITRPTSLIADLAPPVVYPVDLVLRASVGPCPTVEFPVGAT